MSWSGLELVENTGDETLATKHYHTTKLTEHQEELFEAAEKFVDSNTGKSAELAYHKLESIITKIRSK